MADIIDFKSRIVTDDPRPVKSNDLRGRGVVVVSCACGSTLCELHSNGAVYCARCKHPGTNIRWSWVDPPAEETA